MKELVIISGKGGTGKTSITASLAVLAKTAVLVDCDVDASDLHLILEPEVKNTHDFIEGNFAEIDKNICINCGKCFDNCHFSAIEKNNDQFLINKLDCEGCKVCEIICPVNAIHMEPKLCGWWYESRTRFGEMVYAKLKAGEENSGKLVTVVRNRAKEIAEANKSEIILIDGPPGIGCPVIASIGGTNMALIVTEPTKSGMHDLERVLKLTRHFNVKALVCINKADINNEIANEIENICRKDNVSLIGKIPYDLEVTKALVNKETIVEFSQGKTTMLITKMWNDIKNEMNIS